MKIRSFFNFLIVSLFLYQPLWAQTDPKTIIRCGTDAYYKNKFRNDPLFKIHFEQNQLRIAAKNNSVSRQMRVASLDDTITLVVHVIGSAAMQQKVTNSIIQSQIDVLNEDYQGNNADSVRIPAAFKPLYGKSRLAFRLAGTSPLGEPTNGIVRIERTATYSDINFENAKRTNQGGSDAWNPAQYLNIWLVDFGTSNLLGVSVFPGDPSPLNMHGFVCDYRAFGRDADYLFPRYKKGRTTTHELGHFFNLLHIWGDDGGSCSGSDFPNEPGLDDTPNQGSNTDGNPDPAGVGVVKIDNCSPNAPGIMYQNFMDYTDDAAMVMFTKGQQEKMDNSISNAPDRAPLLQSIAYQPAPVFVHDARVRAIVYPGATLCASDFTPVVTLRNSSSTTLTAVDIVEVLNNGAPLVFHWTGSLAPYTETNVSLPALAANAALNSLTIYTTLPNGSTDQRTINDTAKTSFQVITPQPIVNRIDEGFSTAQFPPPNWYINNPDKDLTWEYISSVGKNAPGAAWINNWNNATNHLYDDLITPGFSYGPVDSVYLYFNLAGTYSNSPTGFPIDTLSILVTKDCGATFTTLYKKWGKDLQTFDASFPLTTEFFPSVSQWRRDSVNLGAALGTSASQFQVYFRFSGNYENNIFLDDVSIVTEVLPPILKSRGYLIYPTAFQQQVFVWHYLPPTDLRSIAVYNSIGQRVWLQQFNNNAEKIIAVDLQRQSAGIYFVQLMYADGRKTFTQRIVKQ